MLNYIFYLIAFFLLLPNRVREIPFVILALYSIFIYIKNRKINVQLFLLTSLFFFVNLFSLVYTSDLKTGFTRIEGFLPFFYLPLAYSILLKNDYKVEEKVAVNWMVLFNLSTLFFLIISSIYFYFSPLSITFNDIRTVLDKIPYINIHPTYFSIIAILGTLTSYYLTKHHFKTGVFFIFLNLFALFLSGSRASFLFYFILLVALFIKKRMAIKYKISIALSFLAIFYLLFTINYDFRNKFIFIFDKKSYSKVDINESTSIRYAIWDCSISQIKKTNILLGNGVGDVHNVLQNCYDCKFPLLDQNYNSHNQYFGIYLGSGILGLISLLVYLVIILKKGYLLKNKLLTTLIIFYIFTFNFENVIERKYGILIFLFFSLFVFNFFFSNIKSDVE